MPNEVAPEGTLWVCMACGKTSRDLYGEQAINKGWDESCVLNAALCNIDKMKYGPDGRVVHVDEIIKEP